jgi:alpha-galactosidase
LSLLTTDEVLDVHQDTLGKQAACVWKDGSLEAWVKPLRDGTFANGLFNCGIEAAMVSMPIAMAGLSGELSVRDLWKRKDGGKMTGSIHAKVPAHGMAFCRVGRTNAAPGPNASD